MTDYKAELLDCHYWENNNDRDAIDAYDVLFCVYGSESYEGNVLAILRKDGKLYEYEDSHCSCNGFTFNPVEVTADYVKQRAAGSPSYCATNAQWADFRAFAESLPRSSP